MIVLIILGIVALVYILISFYIAIKLAYAPHKPIDKMPASLGLTFANVTFPSREDRVQLRGWFIPGVLANGCLTAERTIIVVHGVRTNRADADAGLLDLSGALARNGLAILAFDMRGTGQSPRAPVSLGYFEQRDVLGAVDFLQSGSLPYPDLGRPHCIGGWGVSMGAATLIMATARETAIRAIVSDCAYAEITPILQREIPKESHLPSVFTAGALLAARLLYGVDFYAVRPVDVVAKIAPRPIFFIHGAADEYIEPSNMNALAKAACMAPKANVQTWLVPGAAHAQSFNDMKQEYVARVVAFYDAALESESEGT
ncbi:MAG: alpha/beta hydrolase [Ktedonobacteraceae bacterium]|nr:alpha/beta hydrolase [Ktedonobacteraceae bacterium]